MAKKTSFSSCQEAWDNMEDPAYANAHDDEECPHGVIGECDECREEAELDRAIAKQEARQMQLEIEAEEQMWAGMAEREVPYYGKGC